MKKPAMEGDFKAFLDLHHEFGRTMWVRFNSLRKKHGLSPPAYGILWHLRGMGPASLSVIRAFLPGHASALTQLVDRLVARGLVARDRDPEDRRRVRVAITGRGEALLDAIEPFGVPLAVMRFHAMGPARRKRALQAARLLIGLMIPEPDSPGRGKKS